MMEILMEIPPRVPGTCNKIIQFMENRVDLLCFCSLQRHDDKDDEVVVKLTMWVTCLVVEN